jgi:hypothetical protein
LAQLRRLQDALNNFNATDWRLHAFGIDRQVDAFPLAKVADELSISLDQCCGIYRGACWPEGVGPDIQRENRLYLLDTGKGVGSRWQPARFNARRMNLGCDAEWTATDGDEEARAVDILRQLGATMQALPPMTTDVSFRGLNTGGTIGWLHVLVELYTADRLIGIDATGIRGWAHWNREMPAVLTKVAVGAPIDPGMDRSRKYVVVRNPLMASVGAIDYLAEHAATAEISAGPNSARSTERGEGRANTDSTPKRRGRKKADDATIQCEAALAAEWERARDAGAYKPQFAKDNGLTVSKLDALLDRVAKRNQRSDK